jgi:hypothetical protein
MHTKDFSEAWELLTDSQDIEAVLDSSGRADLSEDVTGVFVLMGDGEYQAVYVTTSSRPYDPASYYDKLLIPGAYAVLRDGRPASFVAWERPEIRARVQLGGGAIVTVRNDEIAVVEGAGDDWR